MELLKHFDNGERYLIVNRRQAFLANRDAVFRSGTPAAFIILDLRRCYDRFLQLVGRDDRQFGVRQVATVAGVARPTVEAWIKAGIIRPSVRAATPGSSLPRAFSFADAFIAATVGTLSRHGVPLANAKRVAHFLYQKMAPARRPIPDPSLN